MAMVRWDPFSEMMTVQRDMNRLFSSLGMPLYTSKGDGERVAWMPTVDVMRKGEDLVVRAELPGVKPEDIDVSMTDDVLTIKGKREERHEEQQGEYIRQESSYGSFERQIMLPQGVQTSDIHAEYHDGVLELTVGGAAKEAKPQTQHIPIAGVQQQGQMGGQETRQQTAMGQQTGGQQTGGQQTGGQQTGGQQTGGQQTGEQPVGGGWIGGEGGRQG